jgi:UDP-glucose:(heptosyl)LPS alpha-1,3-glucosyltransferase
LQRDFMRIALECQKRGHQIRVYTLIWEGDVPPGFEVLVAPVKAFFNHRRNEKLSAWMEADLAKRPVDRLIGFNKMPGLDVYYAADGCFEDKAQNLRHSLYRRWGRYRHFAEYERGVRQGRQDRSADDFRSAAAAVHQALRHAAEALPPAAAGHRPGPRRPANADQIRAGFRAEFNLKDDELLLVQIGSGFKTKGVDRSLKALAALPAELKKRTRLFVIGQDDPKLFQMQSATWAWAIT